MKTLTPEVRYRISWLVGGLICAFSLIDDSLKFILVWFPGIDLADWFIWLIGYLPMNLLFLIRLGAGYLGGKKSGQKLAVFLTTTVIGLIPVIDGLVPELTIEALGTILITRKEDREKAKEDAEKAAQEEGARQQRMDQLLTMRRKREAAIQAANDAEQEEYEMAA